MPSTATKAAARRTGRGLFAALTGRVSAKPALRAAQSSVSGQTMQAGLAAVQTVAPRSIRLWAKSPDRSSGTSFRHNDLSFAFAAGSGSVTAKSLAITRSALASIAAALRNGKAQLEELTSAVKGIPLTGGAEPPAPAPGKAQAKAAPEPVKEAAAAFDAFAKAHPDSTLAPNAQYWLGNANYALHDCKKAIEAHRVVVARWPQNPKAPDSLVNIATCQQELGDAKGARTSLEAVLAKYPDSSAAATAKQRLKK